MRLDGCLREAKIRRSDARLRRGASTRLARLTRPQPSAEHRTYRGRDRGESRPGADRSPSRLMREISADQSKTAGNQQSAPDSLKTSGQDQLANIWSKAAPSRGRREEHNAGGEHFPAAVQVA